MGVAMLGTAAAFKKQFTPLPARELGYFALLGFLGITFHQWLQSNGLVTAQATTTAWIITTTPIFIALLGWAPGDDREVVSRKEMIESFTLERVGKTSARFNNTKLDWMNSLYIRQLPADELLRRLTPFLQKAGVEPDRLPEGWLQKVVELHIERFKTLADFYVQTAFLFTEEVDYDPTAVEKHLKKDGVPELLQETHSELSKVEDFDKESLERCLRSLVERRGIGFGKLAQPLRVAVTGKTVSAGLFETMELLGKEKTLRRISHCLSTFCKAGSV